MNSNDGGQRRFRITIRVSGAERRFLNEAATRRGITLSAHAREVLLGAKPSRAARIPSVDAMLLVGILDRLGVIASAMRTFSATVSVRFGTDLPAVERELLRSLSELRSLRSELLLALGKRQHLT